jgi:rod shape-determining protein MreC
LAMRPEIREATRATPQSGSLVLRFTGVLLVAFGVVALIVSKSNENAAQHARVLMMDALAPVLEVTSRPVETIEGLIGQGRRFWTTYEENQHLHRDVERLQQWQAIARRLEQENAILRSQLNMVPETRPDFVSARVIADTRSPFVKTLLINAGKREGVGVGHAVVTGDGLAGRIVETGKKSARVLLLTDLNSRVPVIVESTRYRGILAGDNTDRPRLIFLPAGTKVANGQRIVTSGHGGVFPVGLAIGIISTANDGEIRVQPFADWERVEYLSVLRYDTPQLQELRRGIEAGER